MRQSITDKGRFMLVGADWEATVFLELEGDEPETMGYALDRILLHGFFDGLNLVAFKQSVEIDLKTMPESEIYELEEIFNGELRKR